jgi:3-deoxy-D-manno-octulosonate 8-phosphate phosphatase (KDO 8-P phosphatase)
VADAVAEVRNAATCITRATGGHGAMRELIENILRAQGRWDAAIATFLEEISRGA